MRHFQHISRQNDHCLSQSECSWHWRLYVWSELFELSFLTSTGSCVCFASRLFYVGLLGIVVYFLSSAYSQMRICIWEWSHQSFYHIDAFQFIFHRRENTIFIFVYPFEWTDHHQHIFKCKSQNKYQNEAFYFSVISLSSIQLLTSLSSRISCFLFEHVSRASTSHPSH